MLSWHPHEDTEPLFRELNPHSGNWTKLAMAQTKNWVSRRSCLSAPDDHARSCGKDSLWRKVPVFGTLTQWCGFGGTKHQYFNVFSPPQLVLCHPL